MSGRLDLLIPGLLGPVPVHPDDLPPAPVLGRLLGRADRLPLPGGPAGTDPLATLFALFGVASSSGRDLPSAPFCRLADCPGADPQAYVLHADPVHFRPDRDRLLLFAGPRLAPSQEEADALTALFNQHFVTDGLRLEAPTPDRWYLLAQHPPDLVTSPLHAAMGRPVAGLLPTGPDSRAWARILNEVQMLFHHAETNRQREAAGRLSLGGIWPWGGGRLSDMHPQADYGQVFAADPLATGLALAAGIPATPLPADQADLLAATNSPVAAILLHWHGLWEPVLEADGAGWIDGLRVLETWLAALTARMGSRLALNLFPGNGECFRYRSQSRYRFWRQPFPLGKRLLQGMGKPD